MRILFVEDESELNALATGQLERQGHKVISVASVGAAEEVIADQGQKIDVVIADHRLPDGFGVAFCVQCRVRHPHISVAVVSGCLKREDIDLMQEYGVPYWRKPILYSQVATALQEARMLEKVNRATHLERQQAEAPSPAPAAQPTPEPRPAPASKPETEPASQSESESDADSLSDAVAPAEAQTSTGRRSSFFRRVFGS